MNKQTILGTDSTLIIIYLFIYIYTFGALKPTIGKQTVLLCRLDS
jgi:hypothetical protein